MNKKINPEHLLQLASEASEKAYAPYSKFSVGACAMYEDGSLYLGCNVENSSYSLTICAERNAISNAVANGKYKELIAIAIYSPNTKQCYPCGACRQLISEFEKDTAVIVEGLDGKPEIITIRELLPYPFILSQ